MRYSYNISALSFTLIICSILLTLYPGKRSWNIVWLFLPLQPGLKRGAFFKTISWETFCFCLELKTWQNKCAALSAMWKITRWAIHLCSLSICKQITEGLPTHFPEDKTLLSTLELIFRTVAVMIVYWAVISPWNTFLALIKSKRKMLQNRLEPLLYN